MGLSVADSPHELVIFPENTLIFQGTSWHVEAMTSIFKGVTVRRSHSTHHWFSSIKVIVIRNDIIIRLLLWCYKTIWRFIELITLMMNIWKLLLCLQELILITICTLFSFSEVYLWVIHWSQSVILSWRETIAICLCYTHVLISFTW